MDNFDPNVCLCVLETTTKSEVQMLKRIIYRSQIADEVDGSQIREICSQSKSANALRDVQGALIAINRHFYQVLEGESTVLEPLLHKIQSDSRHNNFTLLQNTQVQSRKFDGWDMTLIMSPSPDLEACITQINHAFDSEDTSENTQMRLCEGLIYIILGAVDTQAAPC